MKNSEFEMKTGPYGIIGRMHIAEKYFGELANRMNRASMKYTGQLQAAEHSCNWRLKEIVKRERKIIWGNNGHFPQNLIFKKNLNSQIQETERQNSRHEETWRILQEGTS